MFALLTSLALADSNVTIPVQGLLSDPAGAPMSGARTLDLALYATESGGAPIWSGQSTVTLQDGRFSAWIGADGDLDASDFLSIPEAWIQVGEAGGAPAPRVRVGWVPMAARSWFADEALVARDAQKLGGLAPDAYTLDTEAVAWGRLSGVPAGLANGDDDTTYTAGAGLALNAGQFSASNVPWASLASVPTGLADGDNDTTYTAGAGLLLTGTQLSVNQTTVSGWAQTAGYDSAAEVDAALASLGFDVAAGGSTANFTGSSANVSVAGTLTADAVAAPGVIKQVRNVVGRTQVVTTTSTWAVIPGMTTTFTTTGNSTLVIDASGMARTSASAVGNIMLRVDGVDQVGAYIEQDSDGGNHEEFGMNWAIDVTAGSHTVDVRWRCENATGEVYSGWDDGRALIRNLRVLDVAR